MNKYTRRGRLTAGMQKALRGGAKVTAGPLGVMLKIGKIGLAMSAREADELGLALQAEAEESRRLSQPEPAASPAPPETPAVSAEALPAESAA